MKILYIIKSFAMKAGVERVVSDKMNYLVGHGYDVSLVTYEQGDHPLAFPLHESIRCYHLDARFFKLSQFSLLKRPFEMRKMRSRLKSGLQQVVDLEKPDIIITTTYSIKVFDIILGLRTNACRFVESHIACYTVKKSFDYRSNPFLYRIAGIYDRHALSRVRQFDCLIALTAGDADDWKKYVDNVRVIPNPVTNYPESVKPHDGTGRCIVSVGRLHEQKGFDMLIDAFALIAHKCPDWHVDIYGSGDDKDALLSRIRDNHLEERVTIHQPTDNIYDVYQSSEFYVLSSRYEGYPLVLNEAMSCGIPCVAFRCKYGPEDAIANGENGLLVECGNVPALADAILSMTTDSAMRAQMGVKARQFASRYKKDVIMQKWNELFRDFHRGVS